MKIYVPNHRYLSIASMAVNNSIQVIVLSIVLIGLYVSGQENAQTRIPNSLTECYEVS